MSDLAEKLMELLSDSENLEKIQSLKSLIDGATAGDDDSCHSDEKKTTNFDKEVSSSPLTDIGNDNNESFETIQTVMKLMPLLSSLNQEDDNTRLLYALRPHLSKKRQSKLDESVKMMQLFKLLPLLRSQGIF